MGAFNDVHNKVETVELVLYGHVEGGGNSTFLFVAAYVYALVGAAVDKAVNQPWVAVEGEDNWLIGRKECVVVDVAKAVRVLGVGLQAHKVDNVNDADF